MKRVACGVFTALVAAGVAAFAAFVWWVEHEPADEPDDSEDME